MLLPRMVSTYECAPTLLGQPKCQNNTLLLAKGKFL